MRKKNVSENAIKRLQHYSAFEIPLPGININFVSMSKEWKT